MSAHIRRYADLSRIGKDLVNAVFPDAHDADGYLYEIGDPPPRHLLPNGQISSTPRSGAPVARKPDLRPDQLARLSWAATEPAGERAAEAGQ